MCRPNAHLDDDDDDDDGGEPWHPKHFPLAYGTCMNYAMKLKLASEPYLKSILVSEHVCGICSSTRPVSAVRRCIVVRTVIPWQHSSFVSSVVASQHIYGQILVCRIAVLTAVWLALCCIFLHWVLLRAWRACANAMLSLRDQAKLVAIPPGSRAKVVR